MAGSRRNLYCRGSSVLQYSGVQGFKTVLQYSLLGSSVLQYTALYCVMKAAGGLALYCNIMHSQDRQPCRDIAGWALGWACWARR